MLWYEELDARAAQELPGVTIRREEPLAKHSSFRIGGPARRLALPRTGEELTRLAALGADCGADPLVLGNGTNVLFPDEGLDRLVISTREMTRLWRKGERELTAEAGLSLARLASYARQIALSGLEFAHGIPGSVGGAVVMNAGAYGGEMKDVLTGAEILFPGEGVRRLTCGELALGYRRSLLTDMPGAVVLSASFRLTPGDGEEIGRRMEELMARRMASQPLEYPSAGSTFKRPEGYFAGTLIDQAGLKGLRIGGAAVSEKHAGFIINMGGATCADVTELIRRVQQTVLEKNGVLLEPEVRIIR